MLEIRGQLTQLTRPDPEVEYVASKRDRLVDEIAPFETVFSDWKRHAKTGSLARSYEMAVVSSFDPGDVQFTPIPGKTYFYESLDTPRPLPPGSPSVPDQRRNTTNAIAVGDAATGDIITYKKMPPELKGQVHTTVLSPDGKYVYITGPAAKGAGPGFMEIFSPTSLVKVDAVTLQPVKHMISDARLHHAQIFQDMPAAGNPHGTVWVHYDADGTARVVRDQGGFHNGIYPARGSVLDY